MTDQETSTRLAAAPAAEPKKLTSAQEKAKAREQAKAELKQKNATARDKKAKAKWLPFVDNESLPDAIVEHKSMKDGNGGFRAARTIKQVGEMHHSLRPCANGFEIIGHYKNGKGVATKLILRLKTMGRKEKNKKHRLIYNELQAAGIPVMHAPME
jgi:hypothetical protein